MSGIGTTSIPPRREWPANAEQRQIWECHRRVGAVRRCMRTSAAGRLACAHRQTAGIGSRCITLYRRTLVEPEHVVRMAVGEQDGIHAPDVVCERLRPKIGERVHEDVSDGRGQGTSGAAPDCCISMRIDGRVRRSRGSVERQTAAVAADHRHTVRGAGAEEGMFKRCSSEFDYAFPSPEGLDKPHPELVEHLFEHLTLLGREVAARLLIENPESRSFATRLRGSVRRRFPESSERSPKCTAAALARERTKAVNESSGICRRQWVVSTFIVTIGTSVRSDYRITQSPMPHRTPPDSLSSRRHRRPVARARGMPLGP